MLRIFFLVSLLTSIALLVGCGPVYQTTYSYVPPHTSMGRMCISQCVQNKGACEQMCQMGNESCRMRAHEDAVISFEAYKREQRREGKKIKKDVSDFDHSWECSNTCNCTDTFNSCYSACGGQVVAHQQCVAFCGKN